MIVKRVKGKEKENKKKASKKNTKSSNDESNEESGSAESEVEEVKPKKVAFTHKEKEGLEKKKKWMLK